MCLWWTTIRNSAEFCKSHFFAFRLANDVLRSNPMDALKNPKTPDVVPTDYFLPKVFEQIAAATEKYEYGGGMTINSRRLVYRRLVWRAWVL
jgi:hypothetical protein